MERHTAKGCLVAVRLRAGQDALQMKRRPERVGTPFLGRRVRSAGKNCLEEETEADFNLAGGISEVGVGVGDGAEWRVEVQARGSCGAGRSASDPVERPTT